MLWTIGVNLTRILEGGRADPEGFIVDEEWGVEMGVLPPQKKNKFSLQIACCGEL